MTTQKKMQISNKTSSTMLDATSIDDFVANMKVEMNTNVFLKIDTEGFDPLVLEGARYLISKRIPSIILFEYHGINMWLQYHLQDIVSNLAYSGYTCFFDGAPTLARITGCWWPSLEFKRWSNVVCAQSGSKIHKMLDGLSFAL